MSYEELKPYIEDPSAGGSSGDPRRHDKRFPPPKPPIQQSAAAPAMIMNRGTNKACAACKYQRRKCTEDCLLAPYFPADKPKTFSNAHRLFGVSNMVTILKNVEPDERDEAMKSIIFESDMRARYPAYGCYGVALHYQQRIANLLKELQYVQTLLANFRQQQNQHQIQHQQQNDHQSLALFPTDQYSVLPSTSEVIPPYNIYPGDESYLFNGGNVGGSDFGGFVERKDNWINNFPYSDPMMMMGSSSSNVGPNLDHGKKFDSLVPMDYHYQSSHGQELGIPFSGEVMNSDNKNVMDAKSSKIGSLGVQDLADDYDYKEDDDDNAPPLE